MATSTEQVRDPLVFRRVTADPPTGKVPCNVKQRCSVSSVKEFLDTPHAGYM